MENETPPLCPKCHQPETYATGIEFFCANPDCPKPTLKELFAGLKPLPMAYPGAALGVVVSHPTNNCILLGKRKGELGPGQYSLPGGKIDFAETSFAAVMREVKEETNLDLKDIYFTGKVTNDYFPDQGKHYITLYYLAVAINPQDLKTLEPDKVDKVEGWEWVNPYIELPQPMWMHTGVLLTAMVEHEQSHLSRRLSWVYHSPASWSSKFKTPDIDGKS